MATKKPQEEKHPVERLHPRPLRYLSSKLTGLVKERLWLKVIIAMIFGILTGVVLGPTASIVDKGVASIIAEWLALPGYIFIRVIQMVVIPLIIASIIKGIASSDSIKQLKKTGIAVALYFMITSLFAICLGLALAFWIEPGNYIKGELFERVAAEAPSSMEVDNDFSLFELPSLIGGVLPTNFFGSMVNGEMLQIVIFSLLFGIALININVEQSRPLLEIFGSLQKVCMTIVKWTMLLAPLAVFGLMAKLTSQFGVQTLFGLGFYILTVLIGLVLLLSFYTLIVYIASKRNPFSFLKKIRDVQLLAFSTSSSAVVMPLTMKTAEEALNVRQPTSQFVIPIGATVNMDGTALYQVIATIFLAQVFGIELTSTALIFLIITILGVSIGSPGTPGVGLAILSVILSSVGIPLAGLALILAVDRILDMCRTVVNVTGDITAAIVIDKWVGGEKSPQEILKEEVKREQKREKLGNDLIITSTI